MIAHTHGATNAEKSRGFLRAADGHGPRAVEKKDRAHKNNKHPRCTAQKVHSRQGSGHENSRLCKIRNSRWYGPCGESEGVSEEETGCDEDLGLRLRPAGAVGALPADVGGRHFPGVVPRRREWEGVWEEERGCDEDPGLRPRPAGTAGALPAEVGGGRCAGVVAHGRESEGVCPKEERFDDRPGLRRRPARAVRALPAEVGGHRCRYPGVVPRCGGSEGA